MSSIEDLFKKSTASNGRQPHVYQNQYLRVCPVYLGGMFYLYEIIHDYLPEHDDIVTAFEDLEQAKFCVDEIIAYEHERMV